MGAQYRLVRELNFLILNPSIDKVVNSHKHPQVECRPFPHIVMTLIFVRKLITKPFQPKMFIRLLK